jgi:hypothetical protein
MKKMINPLAALLMAALLALGLLAGGCESDATAPQDAAPALTEQGAATQAGAVAFAIAQVGPEILRFSGVAKADYSHTFAGDVTGTVYLNYRTGGPTGTPATPGTGDWARLYTAPGVPLTAIVGPATVTLGLDITADIDQGTSSAVLGGGGVFHTGVHTALFTFTNLAVTEAGAYPTGGSMTFTGALFSMTVAFDGTNIAVITVTGHGSWSLNLDTGTLTPRP